jgi:myo-inositol-1(or 4)-monophosphatase
MEVFQRLLPRVRKMRLMGSASLDVVYVANGRFDAYIEHGVKLWDICAGQLILERAGGKAIITPTNEPHTLDLKMWNGRLMLE